MPQRQLSFEIRNLRLRVRDPLAGLRPLPLAFHQCATNPLILARQPRACVRVVLLVGDTPTRFADPIKLWPPKLSQHFLSLAADHFFLDARPNLSLIRPLGR